VERLAFAGAPGAGQVALPEKHGDRILAEVGLANATRSSFGAWLRLDKEPEPRKTLGGLLAEVDRVNQQEPGWAVNQCRMLIGAGPKSSRNPLLALGYPDKSTGREAWLFLEIGVNPDKSLPNWKDSKTIAHTPITAFETVEVGRAALMRRVGPVASAVAGKRVVVFGVGALGGTVAMLLAKSGVEKLKLMDGDRLRPGNAVRHVAGIMVAGYSKTITTLGAIQQHVPDCDVAVGREEWDPLRLVEIVREGDVVVDTTAYEPFSLLLNEVCLRERRPLVHAVTMRRAAIGRVRVVRPGRDACLVCYRNYVGTPACPLIPIGSDDEFFEEGCGVPTVEAPAVDVECTANWTARTVLWLLREVLGPRNHCLVVNDILPDVAGLLAEIGIHWATFPPVSGCGACGSVS